MATSGFYSNSKQKQKRTTLKSNWKHTCEQIYTCISMCKYANTRSPRTPFLLLIKLKVIFGLKERKKIENLRDLRVKWKPFLYRFLRFLKHNCGTAATSICIHLHTHMDNICMHEYVYSSVYIRFKACCQSIFVCVLKFIKNM